MSKFNDALAAWRAVPAGVRTWAVRFIDSTMGMVARRHNTGPIKWNALRAALALLEAAAEDGES